MDLLQFQSALLFTEAISNSENRLNIARFLRVRFDFGAQVFDMRVDGPLVALVSGPLAGLEQLQP